MNTLYKENQDEESILALLDSAFADYVENRSSNEGFGDFVVRQGYVEATANRS